MLNNSFFNTGAITVLLIFGTYILEFTFIPVKFSNVSFSVLQLVKTFFNLDHL